MTKKERKRQIRISAINIALPAPHRPDRYISLFQDAFELEGKAKLRGDLVGLLGSMQTVSDDNGETIIRGEFYKYIDLDITRDWFNVKRGKPAEKNELAELNIPDELKPHFQFLPFVFFSKNHRLVFVTKDQKDTLSPGQAAQILRHVLSLPELLSKHGKPEITVEPAQETLDKILTAEQLHSLVIEVTPPNPDDFEEFEKDVFENMNEQRAGIYRVELKEADGQGLAPSTRTKQLARVAQSNGLVVGVVGQRGKTQRISTKDHPINEPVEYNPNTEVRSNTLLNAGRALLARILPAAAAQT